MRRYIGAEIEHLAIEVILLWQAASNAALFSGRDWQEACVWCANQAWCVDNFFM
jgi:hypothetical protein